jgi:radical SAM protein with 4Fe4S-binding SPASM domain
MDINKAFRLNVSCFLIEGAKRGAIYRLDTGDVFSIDEAGVSLLKKCENSSIKDVFIGRDDFFRSSSIAYLQKLEEEKIGSCVDNVEMPRKIILEKPSALEFIWLEVTEKCNLQCVHCYLGNKHEDRSLMLKSDWIRVIRQSYELGCRRLQFIGGEPLLYGDLFDLILEAKKSNFQYIEVYTNATLLDDEKIRFIKDSNIKIATSFYSLSPNIHDQITRQKGSFSRAIRNIQGMVNSGISLRVGLVVTSINEGQLDQTIDFLKNDIGIKNIRVDMVRPIGCGIEKNLSPVIFSEKQKRVQPDFTKCGIDKFKIAINGHNCFSKKTCISSTGNVFPCIMERDVILGNVLINGLGSILKNPLNDNIRGLSKDFIEICKDCEYRYCCFDCRPKAKKDALGNLFAKPSNCSYNPYEGVWY